MKVCHLTSAHPRYDTRIFLKECRSLASNGYKVSLVVADGLGDEIKQGVHFFDVGVRKKSRLARFILTTLKIYKKAVKMDADLYHFHDPELMLFAFFLKLRHKKVVYDIHEDLTKQILIKNYIPSFLKKLVANTFKYVEIFFCKKFDALIVPQPYMHNVYNRYNTTTLVENFVIQKKSSISSKEKCVKACFHPGSLTIERGLSNMLNAFSLLDETYTLNLAGNIDSRLKKILLDDRNDEKVKFFGQLPHDKLNDLFEKTSIGLILYQNVGQYHLSYAIKLFEFMERAIPVIMPNFGEWVAFNEKNQCGLNVNPSNPKEVAEAIQLLSNDIELNNRLGKNGRLAIEEKYNWLIAESRLLNLYNSISYDI